MAVSLRPIAIDCSDGPALARFRAAVLDRQVLHEDPEEASSAPMRTRCPASRS
ncbi:hypothetical protein [Streptomyces sp. NPDC003023]|uniref:hypothetical protein n=1 Tax=Streptomyces sp. NPDC003023 TaxID=3364675 RepID=UPI0036AEA4C8